MKTAHTPGPWEVHKRRLTTDEKGRGYSPFEIMHPLINTEGEYKGKLGGYHVVIGKANCLPGYILDEGDARLIAAAPDLLEALTDLVGVFEESDNGWAVVQARAAIAKAEGK